MYYQKIGGSLLDAKIIDFWLNFRCKSTGRDKLAGAKITSIDEFMAEIRAAVIERGIVGKNAIPEQYPLLRTLQLSHNGYYRVVF